MNIGQDIKKIEIYKKDNSTSCSGKIIAVLLGETIEMDSKYGAAFHFEDRIEIFNDKRVEGGQNE